MEANTISNVYKTLGGVTMAHFIGVIGGTIGGVTAPLISGGGFDDPDMQSQVFYGSCVGAGVAHSASAYMGYKISKSPNMKYMGKAQMVYSGLSLGIATLSAILGRFLLEETAQLAGFKVIAPAILIGKSPKAAMSLGNTTELPRVAAVSSN